METTKGGIIQGESHPLHSHCGVLTRQKAMNKDIYLASF